MARQNGSSDPQSSPLLTLPGELRNIIYTIVLADNIVTVPRNTRRTRGRSAPNGLVFACKQVLDEAIELYYMNTTFEFELGGRYGLPQWIDKIGPARIALVKKIRLYTRSTNRGDHPDASVEICAERADRMLEAVRNDINLGSTVLEASIEFEDGWVWTSAPLVHGRAVLAMTTFVNLQGRFWVIKPSESFRRNCPFIKPL